MQITENNNNTPRNLGSTHYATDVKYDFRAFWKDNKDPNFLKCSRNLFVKWHDIVLWYKSANTLLYF